VKYILVSHISSVSSISESFAKTDIKIDKDLITMISMTLIFLIENRFGIAEISNLLRHLEDQPEEVIQFMNLSSIVFRVSTALDPPSISKSLPQSKQSCSQCDRLVLIEASLDRILSLLS
jgi:hypothetical protein